MKNIARFTVAIAAALLLLSAPYTIEAVTTDLELIGDDTGLVLLPADGRLFDLGNMNPGDTRTAKITIKNGYKDMFRLWMQAQDASSDAPSLFEVMELTVFYDGVELYRGPVDRFAESELYLGLFDLGESGELLIKLYLPGPETGNEYQGRSARVKWVFRAQASESEEFPPEDPEKPPKDDPGDLPRTYGTAAAGILLGGLVLVLGTRLTRKGKSR